MMNSIYIYIYIYILSIYAIYEFHDSTRMKSILCHKVSIGHNSDNGNEYIYIYVTLKVRKTLMCTLPS